MFVNSASAFGVFSNSANVAADRRDRSASHRRRQAILTKVIYFDIRAVPTFEVNENAIQVGTCALCRSLYQVCD